MPMDEALAAFFGDLGDLIFELDADGILVRCYGPADPLGVPPQTLCGRKLATVLPLEAMYPLAQAIDKVRAGGGPQTMEFLWSDLMRYYEVRVGKIDAGRLIVLLRDVHERKSAQLEAVCNKEQLHES